MSKIPFEEEEDGNEATVLDSFSLTSGGRQLMQEADEEELWEGWEVRNQGTKRHFTLKQLFQNRKALIITGAIVGAILILVLLSVSVILTKTSCNDGGPGGTTSELPVTRLKELAKPILEAMDTSVNPCTDFYQYSCGGWLKSTTLPPDKTSITRSFSNISDENTLLIREILQDGWPVISEFYDNCMNNDVRGSRGSTPLAELIGLINTVETPLIRTIAELHKRGVPALFSFDLGTDLDDPSMGLANLDQGGYGLPRDYYFNPSPTFQGIREAYKKHMNNTFALLRDGRTAAELQLVVKKVYDLEEKLANASQSPAERRDPYAVFHKNALATVKATYQHISWPSYFAVLGVAESAVDPINVANPQFLQTIDSLVNTLDPETWKLYLTWCLLRSTDSLLSPEFLNEKYAFNQALTGQSQKPEDWKICSSLTSSYLGWIVDRVYVLKRFPSDSKTQAKTLIENLENAFRGNMKRLDWMDSATLNKALIKLDAITNKVGYPDHWPTYEGMVVNQGEFFEAAMLVRQIERKKEFAKMGKPTDRAQWEMFSHDVNAYYRPDLNEIVFPAGIMQPPFFKNDYLNSMNYGGIGMVIGHELSHGFDDEGRQFDSKGKLVNWWSDATLTKFKEKAQCISNQYSNFTVLGGTLHLNGGLTLGENIADIGGIKQAYTAFKGTKEKLTDLDIVPKIFGGLTNDQLFFVSFAQTWCAKYTDKALMNLVTTNPHSPSEFRVTGPLRNTPEFAATFNCPLGSPMNPTDKCMLW